MNLLLDALGASALKERIARSTGQRVTGLPADDSSADSAQRLCMDLMLVMSDDDLLRHD